MKNVIILCIALLSVSLFAQSRATTGELDSTDQIKAYYSKIDIQSITSKRIYQTASDPNDCFRMEIKMNLEGNLCGSHYVDSIGTLNNWLDNNQGIQVLFIAQGAGGGGFCASYSKRVAHTYTRQVCIRNLDRQGKYYFGSRLIELKVNENDVIEFK